MSLESVVFFCEGHPTELHDALLGHLLGLRSLKPGQFKMVAPTEVRAILIKKEMIRAGQACTLIIKLEQMPAGRRFELLSLDTTSDE